MSSLPIRTGFTRIARRSNASTGRRRSHGIKSPSWRSRLTTQVLTKGSWYRRAGSHVVPRLVAASKEVSLVRLRKPRASDWDGYVAGVSIHLNLVVDEIYDYGAGLRGVAEDQESNFGSAGIELQVNMGGNETMSFREIAEEIRNHPGLKQGIVGNADWSRVTPLEDQVGEYVVIFPGGTYVTEPRTGSTREIRELRFKITQRVLSDRFRIDHRDYVSWILEAVFEDKLFARGMGRCSFPDLELRDVTDYAVSPRCIGV